MTIFPKPIRKQDYVYYSDQAVADLKSDMEKVFEKTKGFNYSINLVGKFFSDCAFVIVPNWQIITVHGFGRKTVYVDGIIYQDEHKRTKIEFTVKPNRIFALFFFIFPLCAIISFAKNGINLNDRSQLIAGSIFIVAIPLFCLGAGYFSKRSIKNEFVRTFRLKKINFNDSSIGHGFQS